MGLAAGAVLVSGVAAVAGPAGSVAPGAALCVAAGQPVAAAKPDGEGGYVCPSGKTLSLVAAQEAVGLLDQALADLQGRVDVLDSRTALSLKETGVPWAVAPDGTVSPARFEVTCGPSGKALSGSARTTNAVVSQSYVTNGGSSWFFEIRPTTSSPQARAYVTCMGPSGGGSGTAPMPGGG